MLVVDSGKRTSYDKLMNEYEDLFLGLGCLQGEHTIGINTRCPPVIHPYRKVLFALQKPFEELDRMERLNIIKKIDEPTECVSSLVIVDKKNGKLRIYVSKRS